MSTTSLYKLVINGPVARPLSYRYFPVDLDSDGVSSAEEKLGGVRKSPDGGYLDVYLSKESSENLTNLLQQILRHVIEELGLEHYQVRLPSPSSPNFLEVVPFYDSRLNPGERVRFYHNKHDSRIPCLSCHKGEVVNFALPAPSLLHNVWLDAKARPALIITPVRHLERLVDMTPEEWQDFQQTLAWCRLQWAPCAWTKAMVNHGDARNMLHLHWKLFYEQHDWRDLLQLWGEEWQNNYQSLNGGKTFNAWRRAKKKE